MRSLGFVHLCCVVLRAERYSSLSDYLLHVLYFPLEFLQQKRSQLEHTEATK